MWFDSASPEIRHQTVWRTWLFIAHSDGKVIMLPILNTSLIRSFKKHRENLLFELRTERVKRVECCDNTIAHQRDKVFL